MFKDFLHSVYKCLLFTNSAFLLPNFSFSLQSTLILALYYCFSFIFFMIVSALFLSLFFFISWHFSFPLLKEKWTLTGTFCLSLTENTCQSHTSTMMAMEKVYWYSCTKHGNSEALPKQLSVFLKNDGVLKIKTGCKA